MSKLLTKKTLPTCQFYQVAPRHPPINLRQIALYLKTRVNEYLDLEINVAVNRRGQFNLRATNNKDALKVLDFLGEHNITPIRNGNNFRITFLNAIHLNSPYLPSITP